jgi:pteridine reductase
LTINLQNKVVLITGGAKRVGAAICKELHAHGANLMIHYNTSKQEAKSLQAELNLQRPDSTAIIHGVFLNTAVISSLVNEVKTHFG